MVTTTTHSADVAPQSFSRYCTII